MRILLIEDDLNFTQAITEILTRQNYVVDAATNGLLGWEFVQSGTYDLIVLDVMLPKLDGISLCRKLRQAGYLIPILMLTSKNTSCDKVIGLDAGADDYIVKPFDWPELLARIRALLRRENTPLTSVLQWGMLQLNPATCEVIYGEEKLFLRPKEYNLLELFLRHPNRVFSCGAILEHLWSFADTPGEETVRAHIKGLRQKLKTVDAEDAIETVYGLGYRLKSLETFPTAVSHSPPAATLSPEVLSTLQQALATTWEDVKPAILKQVAYLEEIAAMAATLHPQQQKKALKEVHKLAGSVGAFGFKAGTQLARNIEAALQSPLPLKPQQITSLQYGVSALRQELLGTGDAALRIQDRESNSNIFPSGSSSISLSLSASHAAKLLIVDDDSQILTLLKNILAPWGLQLTTLSDPQNFWQVLEETAPDLLLLDVEMPQVSGLELCQQIRNDARWVELPIVFLTAHTDTDTVQQVFMAGADDFVGKPIIAPELVIRIVSRIDRNRFWRHLLEIDSLTQLANRTKFTNELQKMLQQAAKQQHSICLIILSLNQLKLINHQHGYAVGDALLRHIGEQLSKSLETGDIAARWSSSKFMIGMYGISLITARQRMNKILKNLQRKQEGLGDEMLSIDILSKMNLNYGMIQYPQAGSSIEILYQKAEASLETN